MERNKILLRELHLRKPDASIFYKALEVQTVLFNRDGVEYTGETVNSFEELGRWLEKQEGEQNGR